MIEIQVPTLVDFDTTNAKTWASSLIEIRSFEQIAEWDLKATAEVEALRSYLKKIEEKQAGFTQTLELEQQTFKSKSFLKRFFDVRSEKNKVLAEQAKYAKEKELVENVIVQFEAAIDFTPDSPGDLKELIKDVKQHKKECQMKKKTINADMTSIRVEARQRSANAGYTSVGKWERRRVRYAKESALKPHESEKAAIERQLIQLDQILIWLDRFI